MCQPKSPGNRCRSLRRWLHPGFDSSSFIKDLPSRIGGSKSPAAAWLESNGRNLWKERLDLSLLVGQQVFGKRNITHLLGEDVRVVQVELDKPKDLFA